MSTMGRFARARQRLRYVPQARCRLDHKRHAHDRDEHALLWVRPGLIGSCRHRRVQRSTKARASLGFDLSDLLLFVEKTETGLEYWRRIYRERAAIRQYDYGYPREDAELLAWRELECRWHLAHSQPAAAGVCAGCGQPMGDQSVILMIDGNRVHDRDGHACLIRYGERWRSTAAKALIALGLRPPGALGAA
jgi:hypothetical protein